MGNKNLKLLDLLDKKKNVYNVIMEIAERGHDLIKGALPKIEAKKNENLIQVAMEEYLLKEKIKNE